VDARDIVDFCHVGPELLEASVMRTFSEQVLVQVAQDISKAIRILTLPLGSIVGSYAKSVTKVVAHRPQDDLEKSIGVRSRSLQGLPFAWEDPNRGDRRHQDSDAEQRLALHFDRMWTQDGKRVRIPGFEESLDFLDRD
jgi:hypothetical protein